ncbi:MAG: hypothetical protein R3315_01010 [Woeseiaceae bacterium]|nr:hypothetical protein [Woeseiaceae bacterium]
MAMQRFLKWLGIRLFGEPRKPAQPNLRVTNRHLRAAQVRRRTSAMETADKPPADRPGVEEFDADTELGSRIVDGGPGKNILVSSRYLRENSGAQDALSILDADDGRPSSTDGFDPYNTGRFDRSQNWSKHIRK